MLQGTTECGGGNSAAERGPGPRREPMSSCSRGPSSAPDTGDQWPPAPPPPARLLPCADHGPRLWQCGDELYIFAILSGFCCRPWVEEVSCFFSYYGCPDNKTVNLGIPISDIRTQHTATAGRIFWTCSESMMKCMSLVIIKSMTDILQSESVCCK